MKNALANSKAFFMHKTVHLSLAHRCKLLVKHRDRLDAFVEVEEPVVLVGAVDRVAVVPSCG